MDSLFGIVYDIEEEKIRYILNLSKLIKLILFLFFVSIYW
jgi:hypothetical protein